MLDLVEKRRVFMTKGTAWVPMRDQASLILAEFSSRLAKDLEVSRRKHCGDDAFAESPLNR